MSNQRRSNDGYSIARPDFSPAIRLLGLFCNDHQNELFDEMVYLPLVLLVSRHRTSALVTSKGFAIVDFRGLLLQVSLPFLMEWATAP